MENRRIINHKLILGGALLGVLFVLANASPIFAYSQNTTHPALTNNIVDLYNLSFKDNVITQEEKRWLIQGSIDEDDGGRFFSHFYDPVYDRGLQSVFTAGVSTISSKKWALGDTQKNFYNSQMTGYAAISRADSIHDFSYDRALHDYAKGDKQRAFIAFGHVLHLLEDAGVPDHTRNDPHPPVLDMGSPYEHEMDKWNPENFQIARTLFLTRKKPVALADIGSYLDRVANYSNNNFFSKDTINSQTYSQPNLNNLKKYYVNGVERLFIVNKDKNGSEFPLALVVTDTTSQNIKEIKLENKFIGSYILDGYWDRLSKEIVVSGAGALKLFLEEAEEARREYLAKVETKKPSFWAQVAGLFRFDGGDDESVTEELATPNQTPLSGDGTRQASEGRGTSDVNGDSGDKTGDTSGDRKVSPTVSPLSPRLSPSLLVTPIVSPAVSPKPSPTLSLSPSSTTEKININTADKELLMTLKGIKDAKSDAIIQHRQTYGPFQKIEDIMNVSGIGQTTFNDVKDQITVGDVGLTSTPTPTPVTSYSGGGGGGGNQTPAPLVTPTPTPTPSPGPDGDSDSGDTANSGDVVINEIAWMGTDTSANDEWLELYNTISQPISITGWTLKSLASPSFDPDITLSGIIPANGYFLLERTDDTTIPNIVADQVYTGSLSNSGESLELKDTAGNLIDSVNASSGWPAGDNTTKKTAQKIGNSWITATSTPKAQNSADPTTQAPSAVTNLVATHGSPTITATWTAPDPGTYSPASLSYDLRYSSTIFTEAASASWWSGATVVASSSLPSVANEGVSQSASFNVVSEYGLTLYFALRTKVINITTCEVVCSQAVVSNVASVNFSSAIDDSAWGMFGKDQYHTSLATVAGPGTGATVSWEFDDLELGYAVSQPVADADGNIYFGAANGSSGKIIKLDKNKVKQWEYSTNVSIGTPAVLSDGIVYFGRIGAGGVQWLTALNSDGTNKWDYTNASTIQSVIVSLKGEPHFTYTSGIDKLAVLNIDGSIKTSFPISASGLAGFAPIVLDNGTIITAEKISGNQQFTAYSSGSVKLWQVAYIGANGSTPVDSSYDKSTGKTYSAAGPKLFDIPSDGSIINITGIAQWDYSAATTVAIGSDTLYVGFNSPTEASGSQVFALNKSNLAMKWSFQADGLLNKQLVVDNAGNVYFSTQNGKLYGVDSTGAQRWVIETGQNSTISPILTEHRLVWGYVDRIVLISD